MTIFTCVEPSAVAGAFPHRPPPNTSLFLIDVADWFVIVEQYRAILFSSHREHLYRLALIRN
ncbi:MAG: hypothetical protein KME26_30035 [Oscillatoria princeps RMCB-10]|nr:hypothetical protein [Oscillatoria princeps RMCB-10]